MRDGRWGLRVGVPVALALLCALPAGAEAEYRSVGQWQVPTEATSIAVGSSGVFVSHNSSASTEAQVAGYSPEGQLKARWGGFENGRARGLSVGPDGRVWAVDYLGTVRVFTADGTEVDRRTLPDSCGDGLSVRIDDLEVDATGDVYMTVYDNCDLAGEGLRRTVVRTSFPGWQVANVWGGVIGSADGQFGPSAIWAASDGRGNVYVSDEGNERVQQFTATGSFVRTWGQLGASPGQFNGPHGIAIGPAGDVFVADRNNGRIQRFGPDGAFIEEFTPPPDPDAPSTRERYPTDLDVDAAGRVYVLTTDFGTTDEVSVYEPSGGSSSAAVTLRKQKLRLRKGRIKVGLACAGTGACEGRLRIRKGRTLVAKGRYALAAGERGTAVAKPTRKGRRLLKRAERLTVKVQLRPSGGGETQTRRLTLR
jgi:sugar lactone lactonase YvrE